MNQNVIEKLINTIDIERVQRMKGYPITNIGEMKKMKIEDVKMMIK
jgi:hypothetical protein